MGPAIVLLIFFLLVICFIVSLYLAGNEQRELLITNEQALLDQKMERINALGIDKKYTARWNRGNPFLRDLDYAYIDDIQNGFVAYHYGTGPKHYQTRWTKSAEDFSEMYDFIP